jgi:hypothetical protein
MNIQKVFEAVRNEPDQLTLVVVALELERQGYKVTVNEKYQWSEALMTADKEGELDLIPKQNGVLISIEKNGSRESFRVQFLDVDAICFTDTDTAPLMYNPEFTTGFFRSGKSN